MFDATGTNKGASLPIQDAAKGANPNYGSAKGYGVNCQRCVQAYEFRRRGYDVTALPKPSTGNTIFWGSECFIQPGSNAMQAYRLQMSAAKVHSELNNAPDGSRYSIYVKWKGRNAGAHVFIAEKENGVVRFVDPQTGKTDVSHYFQSGSANHFGLFRLDDKPITADVATIKATVTG